MNPRFWLAVHYPNLRGPVEAAKDADTPIEVLRFLGEHEEAVVRQAAAEHPAMPPDVLKALAADTDAGVRFYVSSNPNTPVASLRNLAKDEEFVVRARVAGNPNTPVEVLVRLATSSKPPVHSAALGNPRFPTKKMRELLAQEDVDKGIRQGAARNPKTPKDLLRKLSKDPKVRHEIVGNPNAPIPILTKIMKELSPAKDSWDFPTRALLKIIKNPTAPADLVSKAYGKLVEHPHGQVRRDLVQDEDTPIEIIRYLATHDRLPDVLGDAEAELRKRSRESTTSGVDPTPKAPKPFIAYHGSEAPDIEHLWATDPPYIGGYGEAVYLARSPRTAEHYGSTVYRVRVNVDPDELLFLNEDLVEELPGAQGWYSLSVGEDIPPFVLKVPVHGTDEIRKYTVARGEDQVENWLEHTTGSEELIAHGYDPDDLTEDILRERYVGEYIIDLDQIVIEVKSAGWKGLVIDYPIRHSSGFDWSTNDEVLIFNPDDVEILDRIDTEQQSLPDDWDTTELGNMEVWGRK